MTTTPASSFGFPYALLPTPGSAPGMSSAQQSAASKSAFSPAVVSIIAVLGSAFLVVSYYRIFAKLCTRWQSQSETFDLEGQTHGAESDVNVSPLVSHGLDVALIKKIPVFEYKTGDAFTTDTDCPVCLMEFRDNQELRLLPKCAHTFHVECIDTWLTSHSTCPLCRANIWPEQQTQRSSYGPSGIDMQVPPRHMRMVYPSEDRAGLQPLPHERISPTLRGLLNYEDQHTIWMQTGSSHSGVAVMDPGEDSQRLFRATGHGSSWSAFAAAAASVGSSNPGSENADQNDSRSSGYFAARSESQPSALQRTASCKESYHCRSRDREHKWQIPARRPSFRKNPFSIVVRSYSMGTSRRLVHALEFMDLEDFSSSSHIKSPQESGTTTASKNSQFTPNDPMTSAQAKFTAVVNNGAGPSDLTSEAFLSTMMPDSSSDPEVPGAALKSSSGRGRSRSFRSPFALKRSLSGASGRSMFSFRWDSSRGRIFSSESPPPSSS